MPTFTHDGAELHFEVRGAGVPLLFLHGLGSSADDWAHQMESFAARYRVIALDARSSGRSRDLVHPHGPFTVRQFAADAVALLGELKAAPAHVVGLSMGGAIAFQVAATAPQVLRTMTICNSGPSFIVRGLGARLAILTRRIVAATLGPRGMARMLAPKLFPRPEHAALRAQFIERWTRNDPRAYAASQRAVLGWSVLDRLPTMRVPTLVIGSEFDYPFLLGKERWVRLMPNAEHVEVKGAHHALPMESPAEFERVLGEFLARN